MTHRLLVKLDVFSPTPLYEQLAQEFKQYIVSGRLTAGERLPSIRTLSRQLQLSKSTIQDALDKLIDEHLVIARKGSGNYVTENESLKDVQAIATGNNEHEFVMQTFMGQLEPLDAAISWSVEAGRITNALNEYLFHPWWNLEVEYEFRSVGESALEFMHGARWDEAITHWMRHCVSLPKGYADARGLSDLRQELSSWLNRTRGLSCNADDLLIISGAQQGRDLAARLLVRRGTEVVVEEPGSITDLLAYETQGAKLVHVPQDKDGIDLTRLNAVKGPAVAHLITTANFPTGATMSIECRHQVLEWAQRTHSLIVEDAYGGGYYYESPVVPTLYELAKQKGVSEQIIYHGSLSQLLTPALRLGFAILPKWLQKPYFRAKWLADRHPSIITQELLLTLLRYRFFEEHYLKLVEAGRRRRKTLLDTIGNWPAGLVSFHPVKAGFQQAVWFNEQVDDLLVFERAMNQRIGVIPLTPYFHASQPQSGLLLNFLRMPENQIQKGLEKLLPIILQCQKSSAKIPIRD